MTDSALLCDCGCGRKATDDPGMFMLFWEGDQAGLYHKEHQPSLRYSLEYTQLIGEFQAQGLGDRSPSEVTIARLSQGDITQGDIRACKRALDIGFALAKEDP